MGWQDFPCRMWTGATFKWNGYGYRRVDGRRKRVHIIAWEQAHGPIPIGPDGRRLCVLHRCDQPACYEIEHLWLGTHAENMADMKTKGRSSGQKKTHCPRGHPYAGENLYLGPDGKRECRICQNITQRDRRSRARSVIP